MSTYEVRLFDGGFDAGWIIIEAADLDSAWKAGEAWATCGDWDHDGTVQMRVTAEHDSNETKSGDIRVAASAAAPPCS